MKVSIIAGYCASRKLVADLQYARHLLIMIWGGKLSWDRRQISQKGIVLWEFRYLKKRMLLGRKIRLAAMSGLTCPRLMVDNLDSNITNLRGTRRRSTELIDNKVFRII